MRIASFQAKHAAEIGCRLKHGGGLMLVIGWRARFEAAVLLREANGMIGGPARAAARLGMKRTTLQSRVKKLGISNHL